MKSKKVNRGPKPPKPYPEFPLYAHAAGMWAKTIRGRTVYFGPWSDADGAMEKYLAERDYLFAGQAPPATTDGLTLDELVNRYLAAQLNKLNIGEISHRQYNCLKREGKRLLDILGRTRPVAMLRPEDFGLLRAKISKGRNATTITNIIIRIRSIFRWGYQMARLMDKAIHFGGEFSLPSAKARRKALKASGSKMFTPDEIRQLLDVTTKHANLHTMILLGINAGLGNTDCGELLVDHLDLKAGILDFPRPKTAMDRRAILWPETIKALRTVIKHRQDDHVFLTRGGHKYVRINDHGTVIDSVGMQFRRLLVKLEMRRKGLGFYALRHTFRTIADETLDFPAIDLVMGHTAADRAGAGFSQAMAARYRQQISNERLAAISDYVRRWVFD